MSSDEKIQSYWRYARLSLSSDRSDRIKAETAAQADFQVWLEISELVSGGAAEAADLIMAICERARDREVGFVYADLVEDYLDAGGDKNRLLDMARLRDPRLAAAILES